MNNISAKEYLSQANSLQIRIGTLTEQLEYLRSAAVYSSPQWSDMPRPATRNVHKNEDAYIRVMDKEQQIRIAQNKLLEIVATIDSVNELTLLATR
jgi:hypothetical protein